MEKEGKEGKEMEGKGQREEILQLLHLSLIKVIFLQVYIRVNKVNANWTSL